MKWQEIYEQNKKIDNLFFDKYGNNSETYKKNCIEFLVELGEFINETKCFKYWSIKKPNQDALKEELADVFTMLLYYCSALNIKIINFKIKEEQELFELINNTYYLGTKLLHELNIELVENLCVNMLTIANILNITEDEIIEAIYKKHEIIKERFNTNY